MATWAIRKGEDDGILMPILCIKFAGAQNFANAYGMLLLCQGVSSLLGPPTLGKSSFATLSEPLVFRIGLVADRNTYALTYCVIGIGTAFAALFLFTMPVVQKCYGFLTAKSKKRKTNTLVNASNGDIPAPTVNNEPTANLNSK